MIIIISYFFCKETLTENPLSTSPRFVDGKWGKMPALIREPNPVGTSSEAQKSQQYSWLSRWRRVFGKRQVIKALRVKKKSKFFPLCLLNIHQDSLEWPCNLLHLIYCSRVFPPQNQCLRGPWISHFTWMRSLGFIKNDVERHPKDCLSSNI